MSLDSFTDARETVLRTVTFFDALAYPPTWTEVSTWADVGNATPPDAQDLLRAKQALIAEGVLEEGEGRLAVRGRLDALCALVRKRTALFPRKLRAARSVARWLARNPAVRFVALANTTSLAHARDGGDLDFFVIVRRGNIWSARLIAAGPYRMRGKLSGPDDVPDAVCLSYFISDASLRLSPHMLPPDAATASQDGPWDDPYFRYWYLALLPLYDDGISRTLWEQNRSLIAQHPYAQPWMTGPDVAVHHPWFRLYGLSWIERLARWFQCRWFPESIRQRMNKDTSVIVTDDALKFHLDDGRAAYRDRYRARYDALLQSQSFREAQDMGSSCDEKTSVHGSVSVRLSAAQRAFGILWRLAVIALPWQTRWIISTPTLNGFSWEQGTVAVYASWVLIAAAVVAGVISKQGGSEKKSNRTIRVSILVGLLASLLLAASFVFSASLIASTLWWSHVGLLALFAWVLIRNHVSTGSFASWVIVATIPQALLGIWQFYAQNVTGSSWLGIAEQLPWDTGVSVVEYGLYRTLRAYGGFPHPNVFGGWLVVALCLLPERIRVSLYFSGRKILWMFTAFLLTAALVLTFSRGAWIAALLGVTLAVVMAMRRASSRAERELVLAVCAAIVAMAGLLAFLQADTVRTRLHASERLEQWSIEQRTSSIKDGWDAWLRRPLQGWGPGAGLLGIQSLGRAQPLLPITLSDGATMPSIATPLEHPHVVPLALLLEMGVLGMLAAVAFALLLLRRLFRQRRMMASLPFIAAFGALAATDHYVWTLWAGQALAAVGIVMLLLPDPDDSLDESGSLEEDPASGG